MRQNQKMLNQSDNDRLFEDWVKAQKMKRFLKIVVPAIILLLVILLFTCQPAHSQEVERGKTVSADKKKRSTVWVVCIQTESGKRYSMKWNAHYYGKSANIPSEWDVLTKKNNCVFIKPVV